MNPKASLCAALRQFINQPPRLSWQDYTDAKSYRAARKLAARDRSDALAMLRVCEVTPGVTEAGLLLAWSGVPRLMLAYGSDGRVNILYRQERSWPLEYRRAVCMVLAAALRGYWWSERPPCTRTTELPLWDGLTSDAWLLRRATAELGGAVAVRWFSN